MQKLQQLSSQYMLMVVISGIFIFFFSWYAYTPYQSDFGSNSKASGETKKQEESDFSSDSFGTLRDIGNDFKNFVFFARSIANKTTYQYQKSIVDDGYNIISSSIEKLIKLSESKRKRELDKIANFTRQKLHRLQNPSQCSKSPLVVYDISTMNCGLGCVLHSAVSVLMQAFVADRTFVLKSKKWKYAPEGWEYIFLPLSGCVTTTNVSDLPILENALLDNHSEKIVTANDRQRIVMKHGSVPKEFAHRLKESHLNPFAWWIAQFTSYVFRFQPWFQEEVDQRAKLIGFSEFVAGVHIRWGDKLQREAEQFPVRQYMGHVENWYKRLEHQGHKVERVVYLATEDLLARKLITKNFPQYKFITSGMWKKQITRQGQRFEHEGLKSIAMDIHFLSHCSYLVCTLSSSVCRTAYELLLAKHVDAPTRFQSLDTRYYLKNSRIPTWKAIMDHQPSRPQELNLKKGDKILTSLNHHFSFNKGFLTGTNQRTNQTGLFPVFKAREELYSYNVSVFHGAERNS